MIRPAMAIALVLLSGVAQADGEGRMASAAEQAFSLKLRQAVRAALGPLDGGDWQANFDEVRPDEWVGLDAGTTPYELTYEVNLQLNPESERGRKLLAEFAALTENPNGPAPDFVERFRRLQAEQGAVVLVSINPPQDGFTVFDDAGGRWAPLKVAGAAQAVRASHVQMRGGGGDDSSIDATALYLGDWEKAAASEYGGFTAKARRKAGAPALAVQHIFLRVEAPPAVADALIRKIDLAGLGALIRR